MMDEGELADSLLDQLVQEIEDGHPLFAELQTFADEAFAAQAAREATWIERTVHDAIDDALADLSRRGIGSSFGVRYREMDPFSFLDDQTTGSRGCVVWFREDFMNGTAAARMGVQPSGDDAGLLEREVAFVLGHHGVDVQRQNDPTFPLVIPPFEWQKRRLSKAPPGRAAAPSQVPPPPAPPPKCALCGGRGWVAAADSWQGSTLCKCKSAP
jgi:hypothetical protein